MWIETPLNPTWDVIDIAAAAKAAHAAGAILAVDATATAAVTTQPLTLGADIVFHSATKYLNGHSDVLAGVLVTSEVTHALAPDRGSCAPRWARRCRRFECLAADARACAPSSCATARPPPMPWPSRGISKAIPKVERVLYPGLPPASGP